jgi:hypothetical protein
LHGIISSKFNLQISGIVTKLDSGLGVFVDTVPEDVSNAENEAPELSVGDKLLCLVLGAKEKMAYRNPEFDTGEDMSQDMALVLKQTGDGVFQRVGLLVDYLRKKWFRDGADIARVVVV